MRTTHIKRTFLPQGRHEGGCAVEARAMLGRIPRRIWLPSVMVVGTLGCALAVGLLVDVEEPLALLIGGGLAAA